MAQIIAQLNRTYQKGEKTNCILESPTGTGKTICLLGATLGWMYNISLKDTNAILNVIYTSRTHSQLAQVVRELKKLPYKIKNSVIGSRDNYCIFPDNSELKGNQLTLACNKLRKDKHDRTCEYGNQGQIENT